MLSNQTGSKTVPEDVAVRYVCSQLPKRAVVYTLHFACLCRYAFFFNLTSIENPGRRLFCLLRGPRCLDNATWCKLQPLKKFLLHFMCLFCFGLACWCCRVTHRFCWMEWRVVIVLFNPKQWWLRFFLRTSLLQRMRKRSILNAKRCKSPGWIKCIIPLIQFSTCSGETRSKQNQTTSKMKRKMK